MLHVENFYYGLVPQNVTLVRGHLISCIPGGAQPSGTGREASGETVFVVRSGKEKECACAGQRLGTTTHQLA